VTATLLGTPRQPAFCDRRPARRSSPACIRSPPPCSTLLAYLHAVTATLPGTPRQPAFEDRHPARRSSPARAFWRPTGGSL